MLRLSPQDILTHVKQEAASVGCTPRETEVLIALAAGETAEDTAPKLGISHRTVKQHTTTLLRKFGARSKIALFARLLGLQDLGKVA
jgi:DNA-binding NarL/FixJ family response regulator